MEKLVAAGDLVASGALDSQIAHAIGWKQGSSLLVLDWCSRSKRTWPIEQFRPSSHWNPAIAAITEWCERGSWLWGIGKRNNKSVVGDTKFTCYIRSHISAIRYDVTGENGPLCVCAVILNAQAGENPPLKWRAGFAIYSGALHVSRDLDYFQEISCALPITDEHNTRDGALVGLRDQIEKDHRDRIDVIDAELRKAN